jgi:hypothetical protein
LYPDCERGQDNNVVEAPVVDVNVVEVPAVDVNVAEAPADDEIENDDDIDELPQLYCICRQVDYGSPMVMCDNKTCGEWFHFVCVGYTSEMSLTNKKYLCDKHIRKRK